MRRLITLVAAAGVAGACGVEARKYVESMLDVNADYDDDDYDDYDDYDDDDGGDTYDIRDHIREFVMKADIHKVMEYLNNNFDAEDFYKTGSPKTALKTNLQKRFSSAFAAAGRVEFRPQKSDRPWRPSLAAAPSAGARAAAATRTRAGR